MIKQRKILVLNLLILSMSTFAQPGVVLSSKLITHNIGGLSFPYDSVRFLGGKTCFLGDLDKDGKIEIFSTTAISTSTLGLGHIISLNSNGTAYKRVTIGRNRGLPDNAANGWNSFGISCANIGDIDKDGVTDLAIGNEGNSSFAGEVFIVFLNKNGTIKNYKRIRAGENGFNTTLLNWGDKFGSSIISIGDIDKNRTTELVIGASETSDGASDAGAIWIVSIDSTGYCTDYKKISHNSGGGSILGINNSITRFGETACKYQDIDGDGIEEFFIGAPFAETKGKIKGHLFGISIKSDKTLKYFKRIADTSLNFGDTINSINTTFSRYIGNLGDIDGDGLQEITSTIPNKGYEVRGDVRVLFLDKEFNIKSYLIWDSLKNGIPSFTFDEGFGYGITGIGDLNKDGKLDAIVGIPRYQIGINYFGGIHVLFLDGKQYNSSISSQLKDDGLKLYPNPLIKQSNLNIELPNEFINHEIEIKIVNSVGQEIALNEYKINNNLATIEKIDIESGIYYITVSSQNIEYFYKLIIE